MQLFCGNKYLSPLQRRSLQAFGGCIGLVVGLTMLRWHTSSNDTPMALRYAIALSLALPVAGMMAIVGRYVARETDEFIKTLVTQSLLWAVGFTLIADIIMGSLGQFEPEMWKLLPILSIDLFCVVFGVALRANLWRNA